MLIDATLKARGSTTPANWSVITIIEKLLLLGIPSLINLLQSSNSSLLMHFNHFSCIKLRS